MRFRLRARSADSGISCLRFLTERSGFSSLAPSRRATGTSCFPQGESEGGMLPAKDGPCRPVQMGLRLRAGSVVERFGIRVPPCLQGGLRDSEPPFPAGGGPQELRAPARRVRRSHASRQGRILQPLKMRLGLRARSDVERFGNLMPPFPRGRLRDSRVSLPQGGPQERLASRKESPK